MNKNKKIIKNIFPVKCGIPRYSENDNPDCPKAKKIRNQRHWLPYTGWYNIKKIKILFSRFNAVFRGIRKVKIRIVLKPKKFGISVIDYLILIVDNLKNKKKYFSGNMRYSAVFGKLKSELTWNQKILNQLHRFPYTSLSNIKK